MDPTHYAAASQFQFSQFNKTETFPHAYEVALKSGSEWVKKKIQTPSFSKFCKKLSVA